MDERQRAQATLIIAHELDFAQRATVTKGRAIYADHSAKGRLGSGVTVVVVSAGIGEVAQELLNALVVKIGDVSRDLDAFKLISQAMETYFEGAVSEAEQSARMASRSGQDAPMPSILSAAMARFEQVKADIRAMLAIQKFDFETALPAPVLSVHAPVIESHKNKGGKPLAAHWDQMWASIAVALWTGELDPKTQADVKRAMLAWFDNQEIEISDTPIVERARALWLKIEAAR